ncbi:11294_t:CDS:2, partial [Acaulospora colombiana]
MRADFSCLVDEISIFNSEIKPPGFTSLQQQKDQLKSNIQHFAALEERISKIAGLKLSDFSKWHNYSSITNALYARLTKQSTNKRDAQ